MKFKHLFLSLCLLTIFSTPVLGMPNQLTLYSEFSYFTPSRVQSNCRPFPIEAGNDLSSLVQTPCYNQDSSITTATLEGPRGTTVTLFAKQGFGKEKGYIVIKKTDDRRVWLLDLMDFPNQKWRTIEANGDSGGYEIFYKNGPAFDNNVASIKWGQWWNALP